MGSDHGRIIRRLHTNDLADTDVAAIRAILVSAFIDDGEGFSEDDWTHAMGGLHFVLDVDGELVAHAAVVERAIEVSGRPYRTGYVEAVATSPAWQGRGHGSHVMTAVTDHIRNSFELGALSTGRQAFYERLGWRTWMGSSCVRTTTGSVATPDDDGAILVLTTRATPPIPPLDWRGPISCDWRPGDVW